MELSLPPSSATFTKKSDFSFISLFPLKTSQLKPKTKHNLCSSQYLITNNTRTSSSLSSSSSKPILTAPTSSSTTRTQNHHWIVTMEAPPLGFHATKSQVIDYYVEILHPVLGSEKEAQMCIYHASWDTHFGFCCDIDEETSLELSQKDYSCSELPSSPLLTAFTGSTLLFPLGNSKHWLVRLAKPGFEVVSKAQMIDHYTEVLSKVMGNHKDAQMCIYHISWKSDFGFCCELDENSAHELAGLTGVLSVEQDKNFESTEKDYGGPSATNKMTNIKTKKLFITGLSFYTSEKTLREAFEGFGELVELKIIMDKISKRSKGYAFVEYTTEEAAAEALNEMNEKIINGWMITVDVAKSNPPKYRVRPQPTI